MRRSPLLRPDRRFCASLAPVIALSHHRNFRANAVSITVDAKRNPNPHWPEEECVRTKRGGIEMFEQATLSPAPLSTRLWSTCAGISGQVLVVGCMLLA